jgi:hypothetical protein
LVALIVQLVLVAVALFLIAALLAPLESLGWWAGWNDDHEDARTAPAHFEPPAVVAADAPRVWLVYLSGVGTLAPELRGAKEQSFLDVLARRLPSARLVGDIFPYSVTGASLAEGRLLARLRQRESTPKERGSKTLWLIATSHNLFQVAVSADRRYGLVYSFGIARRIALELVRSGYHVGSSRPIVLIGVSGGGQVAMGCTPHLARLLGAPVSVISLGGVLTSDPAVLAAEHVYHLQGTRDNIAGVGKLLYPGRWPIFPRSAWNQAVRQGRVTTINTGPMRHMGLGDYISRSVKLPDGQSHVEWTVEALAGIIEGIAVHAPESGGAR